jgi:hypothetical protein
VIQSCRRLRKLNLAIQAVVRDVLKEGRTEMIETCLEYRLRDGASNSGVTVFKY